MGLYQRKRISKIASHPSIGWGFSNLSYGGAFRFSHSLGVYEITRRMCEEVDSIAATLSEYEKIQVLCLCSVA